MRRNCFCLRHQLRVVRRQVKRPQLTIADRTIMAALSQRMSRAAQVGMLVQPETVLGWHRELVRRKGQGQPDVGLRSYSWGAAQAWA